MYDFGYILALGIFVFFFSETVYIATSSMLAFPLSLHAVVSGARDVTAVGAIGFGGGSTPRLASGVLGVLAGAWLASTVGAISKRSLGIIIALFIILVLNPLQIGQFIYQSLLLFMGNVPVGTAFSSSLTLKNLIYGIGLVLGGDASPFYILSAGKILFFAGLVPLAFTKRLGKNTAALTLLLCAFLIGDGGVRVGEMTPEKSVIAVLPGIFTGVAITFAVLAISAIEKFLTSKRLFK